MGRNRIQFSIIAASLFVAPGCLLVDAQPVGAMHRSEVLTNHLMVGEANVHANPRNQMPAAPPLGYFVAKEDTLTNPDPDFEGVLSGLNVIPPLQHAGLGRISVWLEDSTMSIGGEFSSPEAVAAVEVRIGRAGTAGPPLFQLTVAPGTEGTTGAIDPEANIFALDEDQLDLLESGRLYVSVLTDVDSTEVLRGQLLRSDNQPPERPGVIEPADGAHVRIEGDEDQMFRIEIAPASDPDGDHVYHVWQLSLGLDFDRPLHQVVLIDDSTFAASYDTVDSWLRRAGMSIRSDTIMYHRMIASDGSLRAKSDTSTLSVHRGIIGEIKPIVSAISDWSRGLNTVSGVVTRSRGPFVFFQDGSAGLMIRIPEGAAETVGVGTGDEVIVRGLISGVDLFLDWPNVTQFSVESHGNPIPAVDNVSMFDVVTRGEELANRLVRIENVKIRDAPADFEPEHAYLAYSNDEFVELWIDRPENTDLVNTPAPADEFMYEGIIGHWIVSVNPTLGFTFLYPIEKTDIKPKLVPAWQFPIGFPEHPWLQENQFTRGLAYNPVTGHMLAVSHDRQNVQVAVLDGESGTFRGGLNTSGIEGGFFPLHRIAVSEDGQIFATNLALPGAFTPVRIYHWADEGDTPAVIYDEQESDIRLGDVVDVTGSGSEVRVILGGRGVDTLFVFRWDGEALHGPERKHIRVGTAITGVASVPGEDVLWISDNTNGVYRYNLTEQRVEAEISLDGYPELVPSVTLFDIDYREVNGRKLLVMGPSPRYMFFLTDVTDEERSHLLAYMRPMTVEPASNFGSVLFHPLLNRIVTLHEGDGLAGYPLDYFLGEQSLARVQFVHASADPGVDRVDIFLNGELFVKGLEFRKATPFRLVDAGELQVINIAPADSGIAHSLFEHTETFEAGGRHAFLTTGVVEPDKFPPHPRGEEIGFNVVAVADVRTVAPDDESVSLALVNNVTDAGNIRIRRFGEEEDLFEAAYGTATGYRTVDLQFLGGYFISESGIWMFIEADLSARQGSAALLVATGFTLPVGMPCRFLEVILVYGDGVVEPASLVINEAEAEGIPASFVLYGNHPNPFNPATLITFDLPEDAAVEVTIFDVLGRQVARFDAGVVSAGANRSVSVHAQSMASGLYFYRLEARSDRRSYQDSGKMTVVK